MSGRPPSVPGDTSLPQRRSASLTHVELTWIEKNIEHWIRFGRQADEVILDRRRRVVSFAPGSIFAVVRWLSNAYGTVASHIDILRAVPPDAPYQTLPFVRPGAEILLHVGGWPKVEPVLQRIDAIELLGIDPADAAPEYWRQLHNRLTVDHTPRAYTREQHMAWLKRRNVVR